MVTATGWTHSEIEQMSLCDLLDLLDYWRETPPAHVLLAARYLGQRDGEAPRQRAPRQTEQEAMEEFNALGGVLGAGARPLPPHLRSMAEWADEITKGKVN